MKAQKCMNSDYLSEYIIHTNIADKGLGSLNHEACGVRFQSRLWLISFLLN